jgi:integrase
MPTPMLRAVRACVSRQLSTRQINQVTANSKRYILVNFAHEMGNRQPTQIGASDIERWLTTINHVSPGTRRARYAVVSSFFDDLTEHGTISRNPVRRVRTPSVPRSPHRAFTEHQSAALVAACPDEFSLCYMLLGLHCGFRRSEMAGIELGDITWESTPLPTVQVTGKGGHVRVVPIPQEASEAIRRYLSARGSGHGPLLRARHEPAHGVCGPYLSRDFSMVAYAAGVKSRAGDGVTIHALRHTCATDVYRRSGNVILIRDLLGHQSLATTHRYVAGMDRSAMADAVEGRTYRSVA